MFKEKYKNISHLHFTFWWPAVGGSRWENESSQIRYNRQQLKFETITRWKFEANFGLHSCSTWGVVLLLIRDCGLGTWSKAQGEPWPDFAWPWTKERRERGKKNNTTNVRNSVLLWNFPLTSHNKLSPTPQEVSWFRWLEENEFSAGTIHWGDFWLWGTTENPPAWRDTKRQQSKQGTRIQTFPHYEHDAC